jgi:hypothetical protein
MSIFRVEESAEYWSGTDIGTRRTGVLNVDHDLPDYTASHPRGQ